MKENNIENQYTEELDFSNIEEEIEKAKNDTIKPVPLEPIYDDAAPVEPPYDDNPKSDNSQIEPIYEENKEYNLNENPSAKISLVKDEQPVVKQEDIKVNIKDNKSLIYVLLLGLFLLIMIFVIPYFA